MPTTAMGGEASAREMRRAARKLIGDQGVQIIETHSAILNQHAKSVADLTNWVIAQAKRTDQHEQFIRRNWRARLRWILRGT